MKQHFSSIVTTLMSVAVLTVALFVIGCNSGDKMDPDARIPKVPPSTRGAGGAGGAPGSPTGTAGTPGAPKN